MGHRRLLPGALHRKGSLHNILIAFFEEALYDSYRVACAGDYQECRARSVQYEGACSKFEVRGEIRFGDRMLIGETMSKQFENVWR